MTYKPLAVSEATTLSRSYDDSRHYSKRHVPVPQSGGPTQGPQMLHWRPETRIAQFVPHGGLAQVARTSRLVSKSVESADGLRGTF